MMEYAPRTFCEFLVGAMLGHYQTFFFLVTLFFVLTRAKFRAKSPIAQKASLKRKCLVVSHPVSLYERVTSCDKLPFSAICVFLYYKNSLSTLVNCCSCGLTGIINILCLSGVGDVLNGVSIILPWVLKGLILFGWGGDEPFILTLVFWLS